MTRTVAISVNTATTSLPAEMVFGGYRFVLTKTGAETGRESDIVIDTTYAFPDVGAGNYTARIEAVTPEGAVIGAPVTIEVTVVDGGPVGETYEAPVGASYTLL